MQRYEVDIDYCPPCKGVWLDRGEIDKIAKIQSSYIDHHYTTTTKPSSEELNRRAYDEAKIYVPLD
jgi:Zn-finger nucleic acid-binding protein